MAAKRLLRQTTKRFPQANHNKLFIYILLRSVLISSANANQRQPSMIHHPIKVQQHVMKAMAMTGQGRHNENKTGAEGVREMCDIE